MVPISSAYTVYCQSGSGVPREWLSFYKNMFKCFGLDEYELIMQIWVPGKRWPGHRANVLRMGNWVALAALVYVCGPAFILLETHHRKTVHFLQKLSIGGNLPTSLLDRKWSKTVKMVNGNYNKKSLKTCREAIPAAQATTSIFISVFFMFQTTITFPING